MTSIIKFFALPLNLVNDPLRDASRGTTPLSASWIIILQILRVFFNVEDTLLSFNPFRSLFHKFKCVLSSKIRLITVKVKNFYYQFTKTLIFRCCNITLDTNALLVEINLVEIERTLIKIELGHIFSPMYFILFIHSFIRLIRSNKLH